MVRMVDWKLMMMVMMMMMMMVMMMMMMMMTMMTCLHLFQMRSEIEIEFMGYLPNAWPPNHTKPAPAP